MKKKQQIHEIHMIHDPKNPQFPHAFSSFSSAARSPKVAWLCGALNPRSLLPWMDVEEFLWWF